MQMNKMKKIFGKGLCVGAGVILGMSSMVLAAGEKDENGYYINDFTAPWGRIQIVNATEGENGTTIEGNKVQVRIFAKDDMCTDAEIKYAVGTVSFSDTTQITSWESYEEGKTVEVTVPNANDTNSIYLVLKDKNGNTSKIYSSSLSQSITYNLNATNATMSTGMATTRIHGAPFVITSQTPKRKGYYFLGWGFNSSDDTPSYRQGDIIPADVSFGNATSATLYAIWSTSPSDLPSLADVVSIGDYVNYPVYYDNIPSFGDLTYPATLRGWRVLSKDVDIDGNAAPGTVNLVSAGVPLTYYFNMGGEKTLKDLTMNFLNIPFSDTETNFFRTNGFNLGESLREIFDNKYTATYEEDTTVFYSSKTNIGLEVTCSGDKSEGDLKVRSMTKADLDKIFEPFGEITTVDGTYINGDKYQGLLGIPPDEVAGYAAYWLASAGSGVNSWMWIVNVYGQTTIGYDGSAGIRPVVSLKPEVVAEGTDITGAWNIELAEN